MPSRDFPSISNTMCQLQQKTLPRHNNFIQLKPNTSLKQIYYLVKHVLPTQKK